MGRSMSLIALPIRDVIPDAMKTFSTYFHMIWRDFSCRDYRQQDGFTLIEMLVSIALFAIVMVVCVGALLSLVTANKKAQALESVMKLMKKCPGSHAAPSINQCGSRPYTVGNPAHRARRRSTSSRSVCAHWRRLRPAASCTAPNRTTAVIGGAVSVRHSEPTRVSSPT